MNKRIIVAMSALVLGGVDVQASAADVSRGSSGHFGFVGELDLEFGGDDIAEVQFTNGSTQTVKAGQGGTLAIGGHYRPANSDFDFSATVGYKFVTTAASNADIGVDRVVFKALVIYDPANSWWVAAGPVWHDGTKFHGDGFVSDIKFDDAVGFTAQAGWKWIGLTYTNMEYKFRGIKVDGSSIGLSLTWRG